MRRTIPATVTLLTFAALACGQAPPAAEPKTPVAPISLGAGITTIDVCQAIPQEDIEAVMGRRLVSPPKRFEYYDAAGTRGCTYDSGKDSAGGAHFGYVVLTPVGVYNNQPLYRNVAVSGLGQSAYFNNGADARQLWVKIDDRTAFVVAFGDEPNEAGTRAIAELVLAALR